MKKIIGIGICLVIIFNSYALVSSGIKISTNNISEPPYIPSNPYPAEGAVDVNYFYPSFAFDGGNPEGSSIFYVFRYDTDPWVWSSPYRFFRFNSHNERLSISFDDLAQSFDSWNGILEPNTTYYWAIEAEYDEGDNVRGPVWNFTTSEKISDPPKKPQIIAPSTVKKGVEYEYSFVSTDPNTDDIYYHVIFVCHHEVFDLGPRPSGQKATLKYTWNFNFDLDIIVKAIDINTAQSSYSRIEIPVSRSISRQNLLLEMFNSLFKQFENKINKLI